MPSSHSKKTHIGQRELQPETQMLNYGYDPALSEGAVKPAGLSDFNLYLQQCRRGARFL
ncbi:methionine gamma-lyase [Erwinia amylovora ACW56400]|nr:methionine gamma-lyase [Erwinia amylovora ACW56400]CCO91028.1 methionine gamma-lyase [Erwinia amylovora 01SFR-BO]